MPRRGQKMPPRPLPGDPYDPAGFVRLLPLYLEALAVKGQSPFTLGMRRHHVEAFVRWAAEHGVTRPREVTRPILERYQRHLFYYRKENGLPLSFHTQNLVLVSLRGFFRWLTRQHQILYNPAADLDAPRASRRLPPAILTAAEVERLLALPDLADPFGLRDRALLETFYSTGIRRAEMIKLTASDLDFARQTLLVREGKGRKDRIVPIGVRALEWLERYQVDARPQIVTAPDDGVVFLTHLGQPFSGTSMTSLVRRYIARAELGKTGSCHLLRHSMATLMLENGAEIRFLQEILGHAQVTTTQLYTQVSIAKLLEVHAATHPASRSVTAQTGSARAGASTGAALGANAVGAEIVGRTELIEALEREAQEEAGADERGKNDNTASRVESADAERSLGAPRPRQGL